MNNLYSKVTVACVGIALGFALGANKEVKAATFAFTSTGSYYVVDYNLDGMIDYSDGYPGSRYVGRSYKDVYPSAGRYTSSYLFNIANLPLDSNTRIKSAIFQIKAESILSVDLHNDSVSAYGFIEDSLFSESGQLLGYNRLNRARTMATFDILQFVVNQRINSNNSFGLSILHTADSFFALSNEANLTITTEPVPEPTTIFGSAIGLCLGGWVKRKKSNPQNKATSQH